MNRKTFGILASLARLSAHIESPNRGILSSQYCAQLPLKGWVYLWTFTLPDDVASLSALQASWSKLLKNRVRDCPQLVGVRVFEPSPTERWHCHLVALERIDVSVLRQHITKYGFGRINVKRIPASKVAYVAKYLWKSHFYCGTENAKMVAGVGCRMVPRKEIDYRSDWDDYVLQVTPNSCTTSEPWHLRQKRAMQIWLRSTASNDKTGK